jgi:hypothetical protein
MIRSADTHVRATIYSEEIKRLLLADLLAQKWCKWITPDFGHGTTYSVPSVGQPMVKDWNENIDTTSDARDIGEFTMIVDEEVYTQDTITDKALEDSYFLKNQYSQSQFVADQVRVLNEYLETSLLKAAGPGAKSGGGQTAGGANRINGADHRFNGTGTSRVITINDFHYARSALSRANVPGQGLVAVVDESVAYEISKIATNVLSPVPLYNETIAKGVVGANSQFRFNIAGFDVYVSQYLYALTATENITHSGAAVNAQIGDVQNLFFAIPNEDMSPFRGVLRRAPRTEVQRDALKGGGMDTMVTTMRFGVKLFRPENMVCINTNPSL